MLRWIVSKRVTAQAIAQAAMLCAVVIASTAPLAAPLANTQPILIGQSGGFTGGQADYARDMKLGIEASLVAVNAAGGIFGRPLRLVTADDGGKRETVLANTKKLVESENVLALIGYTSGAGTEASLDYINTMRVPVLSPATGNMGIRLSGSPYLYHTRAGYADEMGKIVGHVAGIGITRVALAYLDDVGPANLKSMQDALAAHKLTAAAVVGLNRNAQDFSAQIETLYQANAQLVVFISNAKPIAAIVKGLRERGYGGQFATSSFAGPRVVDELKEHATGLPAVPGLPRGTLCRGHPQGTRCKGPDPQRPRSISHGAAGGDVVATRRILQRLWSRPDRVHVGRRLAG